MKKIISGIAGFVMLFGAAFSFTACGAGEHAHIWNGGEVTTEATCKTDGVKTYSCTVKGCKETYTEVIGKGDHKWNGGEITKQPSCSEEGVKTFSCTECGEAHAEGIDKLPHEWDAGTLTKVPTLTEKGEMTYTCSECKTAIKNESVAARADFAEQFYTALPTDSDWSYGYAQNYDADTNAFEFFRITQTDDERPLVWVADGVEISRGRVVSQNNAVICYTFAQDTYVKVKASFTGEEQTTRLSAVVAFAGDGELKGEAGKITATESAWEYSPENDISVSAGDKMFFVFFNAGEGKPAGDIEITLTATCRHVWNGGEIKTPASCSAEGEKIFTCTECGNTRTEKIEKTEHDFKEVSRQEPVGAVDGYIDYECANCTETERRVLPATPHVAGAQLAYEDGTGHWKVCSSHENCAEKLEFTAHALTENHGESGHWSECVCGYQTEITPHIWRDKAVITAPSFLIAGEKTVECDCGEEKNVAMDALSSASYKEEFSLDGNPNGAWGYGSIDYKWDKEDFDYTACADKTGDAWIADNIELKAGWMSSGAMSAIAYTVGANADVTLAVKLTGGNERTRIHARVAVKGSDGNMKVAPRFHGFGWDGETLTGDNVLEFTEELSLSAGDTVYIIFSNGNDREEGVFPQADINYINLTKKSA